MNFLETKEKLNQYILDNDNLTPMQLADKFTELISQVDFTRNIDFTLLYDEILGNSKLEDDKNLSFTRCVSLYERWRKDELDILRQKEELLNGNEMIRYETIFSTPFYKIQSNNHKLLYCEYIFIRVGNIFPYFDTNISNTLISNIEILNQLFYSFLKDEIYENIKQYYSEGSFDLERLYNSLNIKINNLQNNYEKLASFIYDFSNNFPKSFPIKFQGEDEKVEEKLFEEFEKAINNMC